MDSGVTLRPAGPNDETFLLSVYASTRADELALVPWNDAQKAAFLNMQFAAQHRYYRDQYPQATYDVVQLNDRPIGRLYVNRGDREIRILDVAILPEYRNAGIGTGLLKDLLDEAAQTSKPVSIYLESFNPSLRLFERLDFNRKEATDILFLLEWRSAS
jgi:GNAT superfamily N-acetyltransferase